MPKYRYSTPALVGPWHDHLADAVADALVKRQAYTSPDDEQVLVWRDNARIEMKTDEGSRYFRPTAIRIEGGFE